MIELPDASVTLRNSDTGAAVFSLDEQYRYVLRRILPPMFGVEPDKRVAFVMLNPSIATESDDDPTIRRCIGYATSWGYSNLYVINLFALRSTDPKGIYRHDSPIGEQNDEFIKAIATGADLVIMAWGTHGKHLDRALHVRSMLKEVCKPHYLALTKDGQPRHPLYLKADLKPIADK